MRDDLMSLVSCIYDAALNPCLWPVFLDQLCDHMGGTCGLLLQQGSLDPNGRVLAAARIDANFQRAYIESYGARNVWMHRAGTPVPDCALTSEMILPVGELIETEFYQEFLRPQNVLHSVAACIKADRYSVPVCAIFRSSREGPFGEPEMDLLTSLTPHLRRALQMQDRAALFQARSAAALAALDNISMGCLLVDGNARVLMANRAAQVMLAGAPAGVLEPGGTELSERLRQFIRGTGGAMAVGRPSGRLPLHVLVIPYRADSNGFGPRAAAIVFVTDPERETRPDHEALGAIFGLTPGEARVAGALLKGRSIEQCAGELAISRHTARNHLKAIFSKTGTSRQGELMRVLLNSVTRLEKPE